MSIFLFGDYKSLRIFRISFDGCTKQTPVAYSSVVMPIALDFGGTLNINRYVGNSLELHLFFGRSMKASEFEKTVTDTRQIGESKLC